MLDRSNYGVVGGVAGILIGSSSKRGAERSEEHKWAPFDLPKSASVGAQCDFLIISTRKRGPGCGIQASLS